MKDSYKRKKEIKPNRSKLARMLEKEPPAKDEPLMELDEPGIIPLVENILDEDLKDNLPKSEDYYPFQQYAKTETEVPIYAKKRNNDDFYLRDSDEKPVFAEKYTADGNGEIIFARDASGNPTVELHNDKPFYPFNDEMKPIFPKRGNLKIYAKIDGREVYPINI
ncbi:hypothetical protein TNIN_122881 [Trichonephila inaurata madagascariensis]|uniref:Uncharacterized protein n=1 Tax=Trichonephila inaurata madagascariensis TaxID=2747483 RepID=A0A8X6Y075_9ARAC|nr:hypothetical protein TNIN_122881 [Trichonephila inaurata madagascariensis]